MKNKRLFDTYIHPRMNLETYMKAIESFFEKEVTEDDEETGKGESKTGKGNGSF